jgi:alpha-glucosidase
VPLPWSGDRPPFGFAPDGVTPWLPQPPSWRSLTVEAQQADGSSTLSLYRAALRLRRERVAEEPLRWLALGDGVLAFDRGSALRCVVNLATRSLPLAGLGRVLLTSEELDGELPPDTAAWLAP